MAEDYRKYLNPDVLNAVEGLELKARLIVEGFVSGLHRSPFRGYSVEFAEHREYVPGDDIRHVDWKVFGKSDRYYVKQYEEETNLRCWLLVDVSESMTYGSDGMSKIDYARHAAAALAYLVTQQQDAVGLCLFDDAVRTFLPALSSAGHLRVVLHELAQAQPKGKTGVAGAVHRAAERLGGRGIVVLLSDLLDDRDEVLKAVRELRRRNHEVVVLHVLDHAERTFPFERMTLFQGLEEMPRVMADPVALRRQYLAELEDFTRALRHGCMSHQVDYVEVDTKTPLDVVLTSYLGSRAGARR